MATRQGDKERVELADGTVIAKQLWPDPRWGMEVPVLKELQVKSPEGRTTVYTESRTLEYNPDGTVKAVVHTNKVNQDVSTVRYDTAENKFMETSAEGLSVVSYLDGKDRVVKVESPGQGVAPTELQYDSLGRLKRMTQGGQFTDYTYDGRNRLASVTDASGAVVTYSYDDADRLIGVQTPGARNTAKRTMESAISQA
ncbi:hypothetical protein OMP38_33180 [Cohnella ginsengisoli]|uniref:Teneurin-like YD-shell domain-containing protein n=1 Tax=Cohnella ginsengisoli TaxID=425004 RepID=A0A9X4QQ86_9BACL|nr:RHS repeat protein [Cohnella ginsengisoli]MDG0795139.1 hypothetical protein [Cohnella ginsengisoli]